MRQSHLVKQMNKLHSYPNPSQSYYEYHMWWLPCISHCEYGRWHGPQHKWDHQQTLHITGRRIPSQGSRTQSLEEGIQQELNIYQ